MAQFNTSYYWLLVRLSMKKSRYWYHWGIWLFLSQNFCAYYNSYTSSKQSRVEKLAMPVPLFDIVPVTVLIIQHLFSHTC